MSDCELTQNIDGRILGCAANTAWRLARSAIWSADTCNWFVTTVDPLHVSERRPLRSLANGALYSGTAGIGLILAEMFAVVADAKMKRVALGALKHSLRSITDAGLTSFGFFNGRVGIAYALARAARLLDREDFAQAARTVVRSLVGRESEDRGIDVIGGAAGAIPALITLGHLLKPEPAFDIAVALGDRLIDSAHRGPFGWSWGSRTYQVRDLCGLAHGAGGCGWALLELHAATTLDRYRYAASQAFAYEASAFDAATGNWPDYRHPALAELLREPDGRDQLRRRLRSGGAVPKWSDTSMVAWCHGAAGIALTRLRAFEILGSPEYRDEATSAVETTCRDTPRYGSSHCLCHGIFGNCESLLEGSRILQRPDWRAVALELTLSATHHTSVQLSANDREYVTGPGLSIAVRELKTQPIQAAQLRINPVQFRRDRPFSRRQSVRPLAALLIDWRRTCRVIEPSLDFRVKVVVSHNWKIAATEPALETQRSLPGRRSTIPSTSHRMTSVRARTRSLVSSRPRYALNGGRRYVFQWSLTSTSILRSDETPPDSVRVGCDCTRSNEIHTACARERTGTVARGRKPFVSLA